MKKRLRLVHDLTDSVFPWVSVSLFSGTYRWPLVEKYKPTRGLRVTVLLTIKSRKNDMPLYIQYSKKKHSVHVCFDSHVDPLDANPVQGLFCCEENRREITFW